VGQVGGVSLGGDSGNNGSNNGLKIKNDDFFIQTFSVLTIFFMEY